MTGYFTMIELLVVVAIITILMCILLPALASVKTTAHKAACASNQKQLYYAVMSYVQDFDERFPPIWGTKCWWDEINPYLNRFPASPYYSRSPLLSCPAERYEGGSDPTFCGGRGPVISMNIFLKDPAVSTAALFLGCKLRYAAKPSVTMLIADGFYWPAWLTSGSAMYSQYEQQNSVAYRHNGSLNSSFADGHVTQQRRYFPLELICFDGHP